MSKKALGVVMVLVSLAVVVLVSLYFVTQGMPVPKVVLALPAVMLLLGLLVLFTPFLQAMDLEDEVQDAPFLLEDDIEALRQGHITMTWAYVFMSGLCLVTELFLLTYFQKWSADWGGINVFLVGIITALLTCFVVLRTAWFQQRRSRVRQSVMWWLLFGFIFCTAAGVFFSEPKDYFG